MFRGLIIAVNWLTFGWFLKDFSTDDVNTVAVGESSWKDKVVAIIYLVLFIAVVYLIIKLYKKYVKKQKF